MRIVLALLLTLAASTAAAQDTTSNLLAIYTFNSNGNDSGGSNRHLSTRNTPSHATAGVSGNCASVGTNGSYYLTGASWLDELSTYTVAIWLKSDGTPTKLSAIRVGQGQHGVWIRPYDPPRIMTEAAGDISAVTHVGPNPDPGGTSWRFVAVVVSSGAATVYEGVEGGSLETSTPGGEWALPDACDINVRLAQCSVDQLRFYSRALASGDVTALYVE